MIGKSLGHYRVGEPLGRGGMGEVYLADDLNLNRKVALKFLPDACASDPERMARFEREAKLLASLNHPNVAAIYGLEQAEGKRFIVMELVEGETLAQRLSKGPLPAEEALGICRQISEGLEAAHDKGVIHRDLKPANVMISEGDRVKILDFGLAKALSEEAQSVDSSHSPTLTEAMTRPGVILGTAAYMSPEQAKGKAVDKRADMWAFGCILYECLTGRKAFEAETVTETLATILKGEPDWQALPVTTPNSIRFALHRCLEKDTSHRFRNAADVAIQFAELQDSPSVLKSSKAKNWLLLGIGLAVLAVLVVLTLLLARRYGTEETPASPAVRFSLPLAEVGFDAGGRAYPSVSPDGRWIAFSRDSSHGRTLCLRDNISAAITEFEGTVDAWTTAFWSPDSRQIAKAQNLLEELQQLAKKVYVPPMAFAIIYCGLKEVDRVFDWFEKAIEDRGGTDIIFYIDPIFDPLRSHPRYHALLRKMNLEA
jgi:eukaryotic-like serine/threonine-protein kinase